MTAAINSYKSSTITDRDATPSVPQPGFVSKGNIVNAVAYLNIAAVGTDSAGSNYIMVSVPSNARINSLALSCTSSGSAGAVNIGIYETTANGGAAVSQCFFACVQSLATALTKTQVAFQTDPTGAAAGSNGLKNAEKPLWKALGCSQDTGKYYDIQLVSTTGLVSAADVVLDVSYAI